MILGGKPKNSRQIHKKDQNFYRLLKRGPQINSTLEFGRRAKKFAHPWSKMLAKNNDRRLIFLWRRWFLWDYWNYN